ncbi:MAG TPA: hypothetical protein VFB90_02275 [Dehalococcoidia bacterium]|nr:hypothetical protein [Dehalococcoidia bacterium]
MAEEPARAGPDFSPVHFPGGYELPPRPVSGPAAIQDAYRQSQFLLGKDLQLLERLLNTQLTLAHQAARSREPASRGVLSLWARVYGYLADGCSLLLQAGYPSCPPLAVAASDCVAAQRRILAQPAPYADWLAGAVAQDPGHAALAIARSSGGALALDGELGVVQRLARLLFSPDFGATLLLTGAESGSQRLSLSFAEGTFHLGWAELIAGWLLSLAGEQLSLVLDCQLFAFSDELRAEVSPLLELVNAALASPNRCRADEVGGRFLFHNMRRGPAATPRRLLL